MESSSAVAAQSGASHASACAIGSMHFDAATGELSGPGGCERLDPKVAAVLAVLLQRANDVVPREELLARVWPGSVVTDDVLRRCIYQLRTHFERAGGDPQSRSLLETLPKRGYLLRRHDSGEADAPVAPAREPRRIAAAAALTFALIALGAWLAVEQFRSAESVARAAPSIAVLPFDDLSDAQDQRYFAEGLAEEILNLLAQLPELHVIARTSSFSFGDRGDLDIRAIGRRLDVTHVLEGSVRRSGERVRVTAQLVQTSDGSHVWSRAYDREASDVLEMQREIASAIARTLEIRFTESAARSSVRALDPAAHEQYLLARYFWNRRSPGDLAAAQERLERAVAMEPNHAHAWALLAGVKLLRILTEGVDAEPGFTSMRAAIDRALTLAPDSGEVHARAAQYYAAAGELTRAAAHWEQALALAPNDLLVLSFSASAAMDRGEFDEALAYQRRAVELDPLGSVTRGNLVSHLLINGRYDEATQELQNARELNPGFEGIPLLTAELLVLQGRFAEARGAALDMSDGPDRDRVLVLAYDGLGQKEDADALLERLREKEDARSLHRIAEIYAWRGDADAAFAWLARAWRTEADMRTANGEHFGHLHWLDSAFLRPLHDDPRLARYFARPDPDGKDVPAL